MHNPELPVVTAIAAVLALIPLPTQLRVRNIPVLALLGATFILDVVFLINTLVWAGNVHDVAPVWCDISTNIHFYFIFMAECSALCISRQLEWICSVRDAASTSPRNTLFEISVCFIIPLISIPIRYSVSSNRYIIMENLGCLPAFYPSKLMLALVYGPEFLVVSFCFVFGCLATRNIIHHRRSTFRNSQSSLTTSRFIRLLITCAIMGTWPLIGVLLCFYRGTVNLKLFPWPGWAELHAHFSDIPRIPLFAQPPGSRQMFLTSIWILTITSYKEFIVLICTEDVRRDLGRAWLFVSRLANNCWQRCVAALVRQPRTLALGSSSQLFNSSSVSGSNGNELKILVTASAGGGIIVPSVEKAFTVCRHDRYLSADGDLDTQPASFPSHCVVLNNKLR